MRTGLHACVPARTHSYTRARVHFREYASVQLYTRAYRYVRVRAAVVTGFTRVYAFVTVYMRTYSWYTRTYGVRTGVYARVPLYGRA